MKKTYLYLLLLCFLPGLTTSGYAQNEATSFPRNEVNFNIANVIAIESFEVGYERFFAFNQSAGVKVLINDRMNYHSEKNSEKFKTQSVRLDYTYYFGKEDPGSEFYVQPFLKYRFGNFEEKIDGEKVKTDMNAFMVGFGVGYEWNFSNSFVVGPFANIARNFSSDVKDRFSAFDFNAGVNIGYRF